MKLERVYYRSYFRQNSLELFISVLPAGKRKTGTYEYLRKSFVEIGNKASSDGSFSRRLIPELGPEIRRKFCAGHRLMQCGISSRDLANMVTYFLTTGLEADSANCNISSDSRTFLNTPQSSCTILDALERS